jgi:hypothetical protein
MSLLRGTTKVSASTASIKHDPLALRKRVKNLSDDGLAEAQREVVSFGQNLCRICGNGTFS